MTDIDAVKEDKSVTCLEELCREIDWLRKELSITHKRVAFLEERIGTSHQKVFSQPTSGRQVEP